MEVARRVTENTGNGFRRFVDHNEKFGRGLRQTTQVVQVMGNEVLQRLNPAMSGAVSSFSLAAREARNMPMALGAAVVGIAAASAALGIFIDNLQKAQEWQAKLAFAARSGDLGSIRGLMTSSAEAVELFRARARDATQEIAGWRSALEVVASFWQNVFAKQPEHFTDQLSTARNELEKLIPLESARAIAQQRAEQLQARSQQAGLFLGIAERENELDAFANYIDRLKQLTTERAAVLEQGINAELALKRKAAEGRGAGPLEMRALDLEARWKLGTIDVQKFTGLQSLEERLATGRVNIENRRISPGLSVNVPFGEFGGMPSPEDAAAAIAARGAPMVELAQRLHAVRTEAALLGPVFEGNAASMDAVRSAIRALIEQGVEPSHPALQQLKDDFERLREIEDVKDIFRATFGELRGGISAFIRDIHSGTQTIGEAFAALGDRIAIGFLDAVIQRGLKPAEQALMQFVETAARSGFGGLSSMFAGPGMSADQVGAAGGAEGVSAVPMQHGGIVTRPTFAMLGEHGREAIIPLDRGAGAGGSGPLVEVRIVNQVQGAQVEQRSSQGPDGRAIEEFIIRTVEGAAGTGRLDRTLGSNFGITRRAFKR